MCFWGAASRISWKCTPIEKSIPPRKLSSGEPLADSHGKCIPPRKSIPPRNSKQITVWTPYGPCKENPEAD